MAVSKKRQNIKSKPAQDVAKSPTDNPAWLVPTAVTLLVLGPVWIVVYYISRGTLPLDIGNLNLVIGFVFLAASMVLFTRWK